MGTILKGIDVANGMKPSLIARAAVLKDVGVMPCLGIVRIGERQDDLSYERGAMKRCEAIGVECRVFAYPEDVTQAAFVEAFQSINSNPGIHGILVFRPMPKHIDEEVIKTLIRPEKDIDCMSAANMAKVFMGDESGFEPCTPGAVVALLKQNNIPLKGKRITIVGRSLVVGKPLAMMLMKENATITVCHTRTVNLAEECKRAEILIAAAGKAKMLDASYIGAGAVVIDVGINVDEDGNLCGDVDFESAEKIAGFITPVPGGVGSVTTSILAEHVIAACERTSS